MPDFAYEMGNSGNLRLLNSAATGGGGGSLSRTGKKF
jgi:hypothetical protein